MATILQGSSDKQYDGGPEFAQVFVIVWIGAMVVTLNSKLLGGNMYVLTSYQGIFNIKKNYISLQIVLSIRLRSRLLFSSSYSIFNYLQNYFTYASDYVFILS